MYACPDSAICVPLDYFELIFLLFSVRRAAYRHHVGWGCCETNGEILGFTALLLPKMYITLSFMEDSISNTLPYAVKMDRKEVLRVELVTCLLEGRHHGRVDVYSLLPAVITFPVLVNSLARHGYLLLVDPRN